MGGQDQLVLLGGGPQRLQKRLSLLTVTVRERSLGGGLLQQEIQGLPDGRVKGALLREGQGVFQLRQDPALPPAGRM